MKPISRPPKAGGDAPRSNLAWGSVVRGPKNISLRLGIPPTPETSNLTNLPLAKLTVLPLFLNIPKSVNVVGQPDPLKLGQKGFASMPSNCVVTPVGGPVRTSAIVESLGSGEMM